MSWLARLDARARRWPRPAHWLYLGIKWYLVAAGFIALCGLAVTEYEEGRFGIGTGFVTVLALGAVKGVLVAVKGWRRTVPPASGG